MPVMTWACHGFFLSGSSAMQGLYAAPDAGQWIPEVFASLGIQILGLPGSWLTQQNAYSISPSPQHVHHLIDPFCWLSSMCACRHSVEPLFPAEPL